ncbi:uncharacterized protein LOC115224563 [Octopus sinensis]|uniref:Uncharacterized protein LOC115224563 n=1 Tax=Octopus sinensis TaxID=2607531 RepID=A0A6P7TPK1_9MOLL|nr:uncharacterized protein LOC115224563 [Octopus sinensis]
MSVPRRPGEQTVNNMATSGDTHAGRDLPVRASRLTSSTQPAFLTGANRDIQSLNTDSFLIPSKQIMRSNDASRNQNGRDTPSNSLSNSQQQSFSSLEAALQGQVSLQSRRMSDSYLIKPPMTTKGSRRDHPQRPTPPSSGYCSTGLTSQLDISENPHQDDFLINVTRPKSSSLSRYKPLPAIKPKFTTPTPRDIHVIPTDTSDTTVDMDSCQVKDTEFFEFYRSKNKHFDTVLNQSASPRSLPLNLRFEENDGLSSDTEPDEKTSNTLVVAPECVGQNILLAVKLPNSQRIQKCFHPDETFRAVRQFAEHESGENLSDYQLVCNMPRVLLDLDTTIRDNGLLDKTLLHLEHSGTFRDHKLQH